MPAKVLQERLRKDDLLGAVRSSLGEHEETTQTDGPVLERGRLRSDRPRLVVIGGIAKGQQFPIADDGVTIGRSTEATVTIEDRRLSRVHARIVTTRPGTWILEDLDSKNGTIVNGEAVKRKTLSYGDEIRIGDSALIFTHHNPVEEQIFQRERMELLGRLGAGVAHDFNNLLSAARASIEFLDSLPPDTRIDEPDILECRRDALSALSQATTLSARLLGMSRQQAYVLGRVDVADLCRDAVDLLKRTVTRSIAIDLQAESKLFTMGDRGQLHQVIMNLGVNARDAMPAGGKLTVSCRRGLARDYPVSGRIDGDIVIMSVSDTGLGMDEETRKNAFDPFFSTKTDRGGTGLGLATVLEIVKYHGGSIDLQTEIGKGTMFRIFLPAQQDVVATGRETYAELPALDRARSISSEATVRTVLVVDDNPVMRRSLARLLKAQGFEATLATNGQEGVEMFSEHRPDFVLLDFDLPILSGAKVFERLRTLDPDIPIILMSGHATVTIERMSQWFGDPPLFLQKPYGAQDLRNAIAEVLSRKGRG